MWVGFVFVLHELSLLLNMWVSGEVCLIISLLCDLDKKKKSNPLVGSDKTGLHDKFCSTAVTMAPDTGRSKGLDSIKIELTSSP